MAKIGLSKPYFAVYGNTGETVTYSNGALMGRAVELAGCGHCGKGHKEWVKVSDGGPYMKARIRLG